MNFLVVYALIWVTASIHLPNDFSEFLKGDRVFFFFYIFERELDVKALK